MTVIWTQRSYLTGGGGVINTNDISQHIATDSVIIISFYNLYHELDAVRDRFRAMGYHNVISAVELGAMITRGHNFLAMFCRDLQALEQAKQEILQVSELLADAPSRRVYQQLLHFVITGERSELELWPAEDQYLDDTVYRAIDTESVVDCGAFNGDTLRAFAAKNPQFNGYTAVEPDPQNFAALQDSIARDFTPEQRAKIRAVNCAVSNEAGEAVFQARGSTSAHIQGQQAGEGETTVSVPQDCIDHFAQGPVTLLKMDIEGFEKKALEGAHETILRDKPILAICGYHKLSDLWEIPLYMHALYPGYTLFLRNYVGYIEYVFYAVPKERLL